MNIERNNATENEVEYVEKHYKHSSKFKKFELLVFIGCLAFSFIMWCYANYMDDPIIQKEVNLTFELNGNPGNGYLTSEPITIYGEESVLSGISSIKVQITQESYTKGEKMTVEVDLPEHVYSHDNYIEVEFTKDSIKQNEE